MSRRQRLYSRARSFCGAHEWSQHASRQLATRRVELYRREYAESPAGGRRSGGHNEAGCDRYRSQRRGENRPIQVSTRWYDGEEVAYPHGTVKSSGNFIIGLQAWAASKNLGKPELTDSTLHMLDLAVCWSRCLDPLGWLTANTTYHVGMSESLRRWSVVRLGDSSGQGLSDTRVQRGRPAGDDIGIDRILLSRPWSIGVSGSWASDARGK
jgi:hypothetical protein